MIGFKFIGSVHRRLDGERGAVMPIVALMVIVLLGFTALAVDWGRLHEERRFLQNTADAAALAGARELPQDPAEAIAVARNYLVLNGLSAAEAAAASVEIRQTFVADDTIRVTVNRTMNNLFAAIIDRPTSDVAAQAAAIAGSISEPIDCPMPLAVLDGAPGGEGENGAPFRFDYEYEMKESAQSGWAGNRGGMNLYDPNDFFPAIAGRCPSDQEVVVGDDYRTSTGNWGNQFFRMIEERVGAELETAWTPTDLYSYATFDSDAGTYSAIGGGPLTQLSKRFVYVPIVDYDEYTGATGSQPVQLKGLAMFFMTWVGCEARSGGGEDVALWDTSDGHCTPGTGILRGMYIKVVDPNGSFTSWNPYGTAYQRLWQ